jgi:hypothetical protein
MRVGFALPQFGGQALQADRVGWFAARILSLVLCPAGPRRRRRRT